MKGRNFTIAFLTAALFIAVPLTVGAQSKKDRERAKNLLAQADTAFSQKDYKLAADTYGQVITIIPNNPQVHFRKGFAHFNLKEYDPAVAEMTMALSQGFRPVEVYKVRAFIYYEQKNYDAAIDDIRKGLALAPRDPALLKSLGEVYLAKSDFPAAIDALKNASQILPNDADVHYNLARAYFATGDVAAQGIAAEKALTMGTRFPGEAYYLLGDAQKKQRNMTPAIDAYQKAINSKPDLYQAYRDLSDIFRTENRFADAIKVSKAGVLIFPTDFNLWTDLSWYYSLADRPDDAVQAAKAAIQYAPTQYVAYTNMCRAYNETKNYDEAIKACNTALKLQPGDGETYYYLGNAAVGQGKSVDANRLYSRAVTGLVDFTAKNPDYSDGWYLLGNAYFADRQLDKAIDAYLKCLSLSPKFLKARVNLGIMYTRKKNKAAALEQYNLVLPQNATLAARLKNEIDQM